MKKSDINFSNIVEKEGDVTAVFLIMLPMCVWLGLIFVTLFEEPAEEGDDSGVICWIGAVIYTVLAIGYYSSLKEKYLNLAIQNEKNEENQKKQFKENWNKTLEEAKILIQGNNLNDIERAITKLNMTYHGLEQITITEILEYREKASEAKARVLEDLLRFDEAIKVWEELKNNEQAKRVRQKIIEQKKVDQTVVQGDQITRTEIKDSVVSKSNVGGGGSSKAEELREAKALLDDGIIDENEFKQMKKEILGK